MKFYCAYFKPDSSDFVNLIKLHGVGDDDPRLNRRRPSETRSWINLLVASRWFILWCLKQVSDEITPQKVV
jgi:hypothetical protein